MRTIETTIYTFDELSDEAKERAIEKQCYYVEYPWTKDCIDSLNAFCDEFSVRVTDYTLSDCYRASISTDATVERQKMTYDFYRTQSSSDSLTAHRNPTPAEIRFGHGATHYKDFPRELWIKPDGTIKRWTVCPFDGLRYYRSTH